MNLKEYFSKGRLEYAHGWQLFSISSQMGAPGAPALADYGGWLVCWCAALRRCRPGIVGLFIMLACSAAGRGRWRRWEEGAKFKRRIAIFLCRLSAVVEIQRFVYRFGLAIAGVHFCRGTVLVTLSTALTLSYCYKWRRRFVQTPPRLRNTEIDNKMNPIALARLVWTVAAITQSPCAQASLVWRSPALTVPVCSPQADAGGISL